MVKHNAINVKLNISFILVVKTNLKLIYLFYLRKKKCNKLRKKI